MRLFRPLQNLLTQGDRAQWGWHSEPSPGCGKWQGKSRPFPFQDSGRELGEANSHQHCAFCLARRPRSAPLSSALPQAFPAVPSAFFSSTYWGDIVE